MSPVYVFVIYFCIRSLVRHLPNASEHFARAFPTYAVRKSKTLGTAWMHVVDWLFFRHGVFPAVKSNRVENAPWRSCWMLYIRTGSKQNKINRATYFSTGNFLCNKIPCSCHHDNSKVFSSFQWIRTVHSFRDRVRSTWFLYHMNCGYDGTAGSHWVYIFHYEKDKLIFSLSEQ